MNRYTQDMDGVKTASNHEPVLCVAAEDKGSSHSPLPARGVQTGQGSSCVITVRFRKACSNFNETRNNTNDKNTQTCRQT